MRIPETNHVLRAEPSSECPTGTRGRTAVMEVFGVTEELEKLILRNASQEEMYQAVRKNGFMSMREDAIIKAMKHEIPFEEVNSLGGAFVDFDSELETPSADTKDVNNKPIMI